MPVAVLGHFRLPPEKLEEARPMMTRVIEATRAEPGCTTYSYAEDVNEPGLIRISEMWDSREHLAVHFQTEHMAVWAEERKNLGLYDRQVAVFKLDGREEI